MPCCAICSLVLKANGKRCGMPGRHFCSPRKCARLPMRPLPSGWLASSRKFFPLDSSCSGNAITFLLCGNTHLAAAGVARQVACRDAGLRAASGGDPHPCRCGRRRNRPDVGTRICRTGGWFTSESTQGPGGGRNRLIGAATSPLIASFDDDSWPLDRDYFRLAAELFLAHPPCGRGRGSGGAAWYAGRKSRGNSAAGCLLPGTAPA